MNKLLFSRGGQPVYLDDLAFLQKSLIDANAEFYKAFGDCFLTGINFKVSENGKLFSWEEGFVLYKGEVYHVKSGEGSTYAINQTGIVATVVRTPTEKRVFGDATEHAVHEVGELELSVVFQPHDIEVWFSPWEVDDMTLAGRIRSRVVTSVDMAKYNPVGAGRSIPRNLTRYTLPPDLNIIKGSISLGFGAKNINGVIMNFGQEYGELHGKGMVVSNNLSEGHYVSIEGYGIVLYDKEGNKVNNIPEQTNIAFTIIEI